MGIAFTAIDFETANGFRGSPCAVGLTKIRDGRVVEEASWLMRPPVGHDSFDARNVAIHGITPDRVEHEPRFGELFPEIGGFIGSDVLVAHNAAFDLGVLRSALEVSALAGPAWDYACTVVLSRRSYTLPSYSLPFVAEAAGVPLLNHHDAVEDARACAGIMIDIARRHDAPTVADVLGHHNLALSHAEPYEPGVDDLSKATRTALSKPSAPAWGGWPEEGENPHANAQADPRHPLYGQTVVFTGNLGISRPQAKERAARLGAQPASAVTRRTTVLVVGDGFEAADLRNGRVTGKARRVLELHERGQEIEVLSEAEFLQLTGGS
ncbi:exonuclease [Arthrobacter sp. RIT-PI-e]|uniref:exonuclease domain-containing protein n=1 Tax=Arthrobacter sp. RIT-PI-e TaxID=1681197 RepID=UPI000675BEC1|nr:exonuclease domain-containing protein [Arthrobacter sp. RIT-PI-e]KNC20392.1 exonuclease [Arthrobacter sp. RIT-PI-e]